MLKPLDQWELAQVQVMTNQFAKSLKTRKKADEADGATDEAGLTFSGEVNFSDTGNDKADFFAPEKAENALFTIKRLVAKAGVQDSIKKYLLQRNSTIAANKKKKEEAAKLHKNGWQST
jgi:ribosomal protein S21